MGISNGVGTLAGMLCPVTVELLTKKGVNTFQRSIEFCLFVCFFQETR